MGYTIYPVKKKRKRLSFDFFDFFEAALPILVVVVIVALVVGLPILIGVMTNDWVNTKETLHACKVSSKESVNSNKSHEYRIYTDNCGVLTVKDEAWLGLYNSADTYAKIKPDNLYTFDTVGWRNGFFSTFPNIVKVRGVLGQELN